jgi:hypothetical protein
VSGYQPLALWRAQPSLMSSSHAGGMQSKGRSNTRPAAAIPQLAQALADTSQSPRLLELPGGSIFLRFVVTLMLMRSWRRYRTPSALYL